jgi:hypothetical protein
MNIMMLVTISQSSIISRCSRQSQWSIWREIETSDTGGAVT